MAEWWTYRPADFLMFAPDTYWRLFALHNASWWPLGLLAHAMALVLWLALWRGHPLAPRLGAALMAVLSALVAWGFVWRLYTPINWAAQPLALLLALAALAWLVLWSQGLRRTGAGLVLLGAAVLLWPLLALADGRPFAEAEFIGLAPDPTVVAGLGLLLHLHVGHPVLRVLWWALLGMGLLWCMVSAATLATMGSLLALAPLMAAVLCGVAAVRLAWRGADI